MIAGIVLGAGGSERFGSPKQLAQLRGRPLIRHALDAMASVTALSPLIVVLGAEADRVRSQVNLEGFEVVIVSDWSEGVSASLRAGVAAADAAGASTAVITLADQPLITPQVIAAVLDRIDGPEPAVRATFDGAPGHPVLIKRELFREIEGLRGDEGARALLAERGVATVECGHLASAQDVDTPGDLTRIASMVWT